VVWNGSFLFILSALSLVGYSSEGAMNIPDPSRDSAFLYNEWQPNRPTVVAFIDPLCPYCKKVIPKFDQVTEYNLFVYWAPVFGQRSEEAVSPFFQCKQPAGRAVLNSLIITPRATAPTVCDGDFIDASLMGSTRAINDEMVASYPINGVPAFFLQGVQVAFSQILTTPAGPARYINGVSIDWRRYEESRIDWNTAGDSLAIIFPEHQNPEVSLRLMEQYRPEYIFSHNDWQALCDALTATNCGGGVEIQHARSRHYNEVVALLGVDKASGETFLLTKEGRLTHVNGTHLSDVD
jgi:hypothetical protein